MGCVGWRVQETWTIHVLTCKISFSRLHFWFILISFQIFFPQFKFPNSECGLSTSAAYMPVFTVHVHVHEGTVSSFKRPHAVINTVHVPSYGIKTSTFNKVNDVRNHGVGVFLLPLNGMLVHRRVTPSNPGTHLCWPLLTESNFWIRRVNHSSSIVT